MRKAHRDIHEIREAALLCLGFGVFLVWAIAVLASTFLGKQMDSQVHVIMLATTTGLIGGGIVVGRKANGNGKNGA